MTQRQRAKLALVQPSEPPWKIVHEIPRRIRFSVPALRNNAEMASRLDAALSAGDGIGRVRTNAAAGSVVVHYDGSRAARRRVERELLQLLETPSGPPQALCTRNRAAELGQLTLFAAGLALTPLLPLPLRHTVTAAAIAPSVLRGLRALSSGGLQTDVLSATALALSALAGRYAVAQTANFMHAVADFLEEDAIDDAVTQLRHYARLPPVDYLVVRGPSEKRLRCGELREGDRIRLKKADVVPVEGVVRSGVARVKHAFAGDAECQDVAPGELLSAHSALESGEIEVALTCDWEKSGSFKLQRFIEQSVRYKDRATQYSLEVADRLVPYSLAISAAVFGFTRDIGRTSAALNVDFSSPLRLATPVAVESAIANGATSGVLFKDGAAIEKLARVDTVVFDKTGTLTHSHWQVAAIDSSGTAAARRASRWFSQLILVLCRGFDKAESKRAAISLKSISHAECAAIESSGLSALIDGRMLMLGTPEMLKQRFDIDCSRMPGSDPDGKHLVLACDGEAVASVRLTSRLRNETAATLAVLKRVGIRRICVLTHESDEQLPAELKALPGIDQIIVEQGAASKTQFVQQLRDDGRQVAVVSDGLFGTVRECVNICFSAEPDSSLSGVDVWILNRDLGTVASAREMATAAIRIIERNARLNVAGNSAVLLAASFGRISPTMAAALSNGLTLAMLQTSRH